MEEQMTKCQFCNQELSEEDEIVFDGVTMCPDCLNEETTICENCNERIWQEDDEGGDNHTLCTHCFENYYTSCDRCETLIHNNESYYDDDEDVALCYTCYSDNMKNYVIKSYSYKPMPLFYGDGLFLGIELEIDLGGEINSNAEKLLNIANENHDHLYIKHDGSIDDGFELVSHPMDLAYHTKYMPWKDILSSAVHMGYRSHQTSTCGFHVHFSRSALGKTIDEQEEVIARILYFVEANWNELLRFSRRTENQINRWAARYGLRDNPQLTYKDAKDKRLGRYVCVNLENANTVELRIFRGTLRYETFIAVLQMVDEICNTAISLSDYDFQSITWNEFVANINPEKQELINYLKLRRLYVNEPIEENGEEI